MLELRVKAEKSLVCGICVIHHKIFLVNVDTECMTVNFDSLLFYRLIQALLSSFFVLDDEWLTVTFTGVAYSGAP